MTATEIFPRFEVKSKIAFHSHNNYHHFRRPNRHKHAALSERTTTGQMPYLKLIELFPCRVSSAMIDLCRPWRTRFSLKTSPQKNILTLSTSLKAMGTPAMVVYSPQRNNGIIRVTKFIFVRIFFSNVIIHSLPLNGYGDSVVVGVRGWEKYHTVQDVVDIYILAIPQEYHNCH